MDAGWIGFLVERERWIGERSWGKEVVATDPFEESRSFYEAEVLRFRSSLFLGRVVY